MRQNRQKDLLEQVIHHGSETENESRTEQFETSIPITAYCSQICQYAAAMNLEYALMIFCITSAHPEKYFSVSISKHHADIVEHKSSLVFEKMPYVHLF